SDASWFSEGLAPVMMNGKWGYIDRAGKMVIPAKFSSAKAFRKGFVENGTNGGDTVLFAAATIGNSENEICINVKGQTMKKCPAIGESSIAGNNDPVKSVTTTKKYDLPNNSGLFDKIIDDYKVAGSDETYYLAMKGNMYGVFNSKFETIVPFEYSSIKMVNSGPRKYLEVDKGNLYGLYSPTGQQIYTPEYTRVITVNGTDNNEYYIIQKDGKTFVRDGNNKDFIANGYANITYDNGGFIITDENKLQGYYFMDNKIIAPKYMEVKSVDGGKYLLVKTASGRQGYINADGYEYFLE
ncbi:MAG: WG repeat-containing protein, partial [Ferruginibacter sp.]